MARLIVDNVANNATTTTSVTGNANRNNSSKKFTTEALRHPEKVLGCASASVLPEYLFSEKNGGGRRQHCLTAEEDSHGKPKSHPEEGAKDCRLQQEELGQEPLSRLSLEVREAIDSDPMYGEFCHVVFRFRMPFGLLLLQLICRDVHYVSPPLCVRAYRSQA